MQQPSILNHFKHKKLKNINDANKTKEIEIDVYPSKSNQPKQTNLILDNQPTNSVKKRARRDNSLEIIEKTKSTRIRKKKEFTANNISLFNTITNTNKTEDNLQSIIIDEDDIELKKKKYEDFQKLFERKPSNESQKTCTSTKKKISLIDKAGEEILSENLKYDLVNNSDINNNINNIKDKSEIAPSVNQISKVNKDNNSFNLTKSTQSIIEKTLNKIKQEKAKQLLLKSDNNFKKINEINDLTVKKDIAPMPCDKSTISNTNNTKEVSAKTLEIINKLKNSNNERKNRFEREKTSVRTNSESSFSLRFKYEDLISGERELILPPKYKALYKSFEALETTLNFYQSKGKQPNFYEIKTSIETTYRQ